MAYRFFFLPGHSGLIKLTFLAGLLLTAVTCSKAETVRLAVCAATVAAVANPNSHISIRGVEFPKDGRPILRVDFFEEKDGVIFRRWLFCAFRQSGYRGADDLLKLETEDGPIVGARLWSIRRFWLGQRTSAIEALEKMEWEDGLLHLRVTGEDFP